MCSSFLATYSDARHGARYEGGVWGKGRSFLLVLRILAEDTFSFSQQQRQQLTSK